jgi:hypothetical protein
VAGSVAFLSGPRTTSTASWCFGFEVNSGQIKKKAYMQYYGLQSIVASQKKPIELKSPSESFFMKTARVTPYIEPSFTKEDCPSEKPAILLVSAVGASGKSTTAQALAFDTGLPILDLAKHKPVGDNTLTGTLTSAYPVEKIGAVLEGLCSGNHGIIIDGIDEGRSKTTERAFEAFLDDLIKLSKNAKATSIVVFGRGQVLLSTWCYLADRDADVGLVRIDPFNLEQAKRYIDAYVQHRNPSQQTMYEQARDSVLQKLGAAFASSENGEDAFLSFIGYPPVLDAIATLLRTEPNYHRVHQALHEGADDDLEVKLLIRIAEFLLRREREDKALPNFIDEIISKADAKSANELREILYDEDEQCARVLARVLGRDFPRQIILDAALNDEYEKALTTWCPEHPFLDDKRVRNVVFDAVAVARCALSTVPEYRTLAFDYVIGNRPTYHLLYIMAQLARNREIGIEFFNMLIQSCSDFMGKGHEIQIEVNGLSWDEPDLPVTSSAELEVDISIPKAKQQRTFKFKSTVSATEEVPLGPFLANAVVNLPCEITMSGSPALDCMGTCRIVAKRVHIDTPDLVVRGIPQVPQAADGNESGLFLDVGDAQGHANAVTIKGGKLEISCTENGLSFPLAKYVQKTQKTIADPAIAEKFRRLRRILSEFASHSKGGLAKYRIKIEHERVLRGQVGENVLSQLLEEKILYSDPKFYYVDSDQLSKVLGTTWHELRQHKLSKDVEKFLKRVK